MAIPEWNWVDPPTERYALLATIPTTSLGGGQRSQILPPASPPTRPGPIITTPRSFLISPDPDGSVYFQFSEPNGPRGNPGGIPLLLSRPRSSPAPAGGGESRSFEHTPSSFLLWGKADQRPSFEDAPSPLERGCPGWPGRVRGLATAGLMTLPSGPRSILAGPSASVVRQQYWYL